MSEDSETVHLMDEELEDTGYEVPKHAPQFSKMVFPFPKPNVMLEMPQGSQPTIGHQPTTGHQSMNSISSNSTVQTQSRSESGSSTQYHGAEAWWSVGEFLQQGITHQSVGLSLSGKNDDDTWDLSDSIADLYMEASEREQQDRDKVTEQLKESKTEIDKKWLEKDTNNGFVRVFQPDSEVSKVFPCTLSTTAHKLCLQCGRPPNSLHIQLNGDIIRRLEPIDSPLAIQNEYLQTVGYKDIRKIQQMGLCSDLPWLVKFYAGKPLSDGTYSRNQLTSYAYVRKGKLLHQWVRRLCVVSGTRLLIYRDKNKTTKPTVVQLAKGEVEEVTIKGHERCLKLTSTQQGDRSVYLSFDSDNDYSKWLRKTKKATAKLPSKADLSNCHLEFLPETVFINEDLRSLNLRHNALKERPIEEDIYTIGWLDDLPKFHSLCSLNLADNNLSNFPVALCQMVTLTELNIASNKIKEIPPEIVHMSSLQMLHIHNNHLHSLPTEMTEMSSLKIIVLAFNHFSTIPEVLLQSQNSKSNLDSIIMAGNRVEKLPHEVLCRMQHIKKIDLRMNSLSLLPSETAKFHFLELVTHLDVRDNHIKDLDVRSLKSLEYLNCERNTMQSLQVNGSSLKNLYAADNELEVFSVNPKPEWLVNLDISRNKLPSLPPWVAECFFMVKLDASHNAITELPARLFCDARKLKVLNMSHNQISEVPTDTQNCVLEELHLEHNCLNLLPGHLMLQANKLKYLNLTGNNLQSVPQFSFTHSSRLHELYLSDNKLEDDCIPFLCSFTKLRILHIAHNRITEIRNRDIFKLENLQEINLSGNDLRTLPHNLGRHPKLQVLRANTNYLKELPDFKMANNLKVLEVGSNRLSDVSVTGLMGSQVQLLDISGNPDIMVKSSELKGISTIKKICTLDMRGQNRSLLDLRQAPFESGGCPWQTGLSQTSGMRNKLCVTILNKPQFTNEVEGLFGVFDGGRNEEVIKIIDDVISDTVLEESNQSSANQQSLKYALLSVHSKLQSTGQKVGAAAAVCHLKKENNQYSLCMANVGDVEVVICRRGEVVPVSRRFLVQSDQEECRRICKSDGIITEDGRVNGVAFQTRLLGSSFLYPHVIPDPHLVQVNLHHDDQFIIIANHGLWKYVNYEDAVKQIKNIPDPVIAAKRLQDLAQGYGSKESIGILVIRLLLSEKERNKMKTILQKQFQAEQELLAVLKERDAIKEEERRKKKEEIAHEEDGVPMDILKLKKHGKRRMQAFDVFHEEGGDYVSLAFSSSDSSSENWEEVLQKRLAEEVKNKELRHLFDDENKETDVMNAAFEMGYNGVDPNWNTKDTSKKKYKKKHHAPDPNVNIISPVNYQPNALINASPSVESVEFTKDYSGSQNVDRDAVLFHQMQIARSKSKSTDSMDSIQSVPNSSSYRDVPVATKSSSHSIEVLIHKPHHGSWEERLGGSQPSYLPTHQKNLSLQDFDWEVPNSCPDTKSVEMEHVKLHKLDRKFDASMNNLFVAENQEKSQPQGLVISPAGSDENVKETPEIYEDETIVSGYKTSPTIKDKKQRAPPPPPLPPRVSLEDLYAKPQKKERRAAPLPPTCGSPQGKTTIQVQEDEEKSAFQTVKPVVPPRTYLSKPEAGDNSQIKKLTDSLLALQGRDVLNIRAKISKFEIGDHQPSNVPERNVDYILTSEGSETQTSEDKGYLKHEPDVNSNSLTSLQNFYFALQNGTHTSQCHDEASNPFSTPSMESLLHKSLSQQSVIETYL
ncbi:PH domain leucine-rich repeat-containing protein phosphatase 2-like isoform X1 [Saccostrea echinata]|uniref:PH domain leucine-rich repeat-containing protein phosphatase 2-like isoform X1 n=1 Tax=Saccostrea echinata TaxID=191078 RepID=UPI002A833635|nr:PH domain leucine-rich repeat-containing protein phosphatase 2-like isoform X1 [Saccostrea echinata]